MNSVRKFIDIGANLTDQMYQGVYNGIRRHEPDTKDVIDRAINAGLSRILITGTDLENSKHALKIALGNDKLFITVGCHPTKCDEFEKSGNSSQYLYNLQELILENSQKVVAVGECGLDYDRLHFCNQETQKKYFEQQLDLSKNTKLPLFLHCRNAADDLIHILTKQNYSFQGVVHSFDGSLDSMKHLIELGFYIGINGCSLKTESNLEVAKSVPDDRLLIETDCPWCDVRPSHASSKYVKTHFPSVKKEKYKANSLVKGRNEPCTIIQILEILSAIREQNLDELSVQIYENTERLFFSNYKDCA